MNEERWGMCAAYGCPLAGSMGSEGKWYCFCHVGRSASENDKITRGVQDLDFLVQTTLDLRGARGSKEWPTIYRNMQQRLIRADRKDLLLGPLDCSPNKPGVHNLTMWLMRLERVLIDASQGKDVRPANAPVPTAAVVGPTHSDAFNPYAGMEA